ncbi:MAG: hypothetical protein JNK72_26150 [Myxococcales bacterium]|nr:hypothetical protein [Myxococcales bacterium]
MRGATLGPIENSQHPGVGYGTAASEAALDELVANGCTWVSLTPFGRQWSLESAEIVLSFEAPVADNRAAVLRVMAQAHARGLKVFLIPHLWVELGGWRGEIAPAGPEGWRRWFASYTRFVLHWAQVAEEGRAEMFSIGVEMKSSSGTRGEWFSVIDAVRRRYHGLLTYSANWGEEDAVLFWDRLDVVGIQAFYPLTDQSDATLEMLRVGARQRARDVGAWAHRVGRPILFTEYGYTARRDPALRPWEWPDGMTQVRVDAEAQAIAYRALLEAFVREPWFVGAFVWRYYANPMDASQEADWGFSPRLRAAETVMRQVYDPALRWGGDAAQDPFGWHWAP